MEITITGCVDPVDSTAGTKVLSRDGCWIRFRASRVEGTARLIADASKVVIGTRLFVESGYDRVEKFELESDQGEDTLDPVSGTGNYAVRGLVVHAWQDNVIVVRVHDMQIMLKIPDDVRVACRHGIRCKFILYGLSLWETST